MEYIGFFKDIAGDWKGDNILHDPMTNTEKKSSTTFRNIFILNDTFLELNYDWKYEDSRQEGKITLGYNKDKDEIFANWIDTWHMNFNFMFLKGNFIDNRLDMYGEYAVDGYPKWG